MATPPYKVTHTSNGEDDLTIPGLGTWHNVTDPGEYDASHNLWKISPSQITVMAQYAVNISGRSTDVNSNSGAFFATGWLDNPNSVKDYRKAPNGGLYGKSGQAWQVITDYVDAVDAHSSDHSGINSLPGKLPSIDPGGAGVHPGSVLGGITNFFELLTSTQFWVRAGEVILGLIVVGVGANAMLKDTGSNVTINPAAVNRRYFEWFDAPAKGSP